MDLIGLIISVVAIFIGLGIYIAIMNSKWGKKQNEHLYAIMLVCLLVVVIIGGIIRLVISHIMGV